MVRKHFVGAALWACLAGNALGQTGTRVDFGRDILPIFRQNCIGCHGPAQQMRGLRLDRRSSVFRIESRRVVPGNIENSLLYHRLIGTSEFGRQMPPSGPLPPDQINTIRTWIEEGAEWPDALANEADLPPLNPKAVGMVDALRRGDWTAFMKFVAEDPKLLNARGPEGSTPFMYAVLYSDTATLEQLLEKGADPNARNDAKATALMWAATNLEKTRVLLANGADVNARSDNQYGPLAIAAGRPGGEPIVKLLLDHGSAPDAGAIVPAVYAGDAESMRLLMDRGVDARAVAGTALGIAARVGCSKCIDLLVARNLDKGAYTAALQQPAVLDDAKLVRLMLDHGADVNAFDQMGRTPLMYAAVSDLLPLESVKLLIERGAIVNAKSLHPQSGDSGLTALDLARQHGNTAIVDLLIKSGATGTAPAVPVLKFQRGNTIPVAIERSVPLLQRTDASFTRKAGCVSCHNDSLTAMAVGLARKKGFRVDEQTAAQQVKVNISAIEQQRNLLRQMPGTHVLFGTFSYVLVGLDAEHYPPDLNTDAFAIFLQTHQMPDGHWMLGVEARPPLCSGDIAQTVVSMRALQLYAQKVDEAVFEKSVQLAAAWLGKIEPKTYDDRSWRLLGLAWANKDKSAIQRAMREVLAVQRSDGGWSDLPSLNSTAYATGKSLVALQAAGLPVSDPAYHRGVQFLLNTQLEDGSWHVKTRTAGAQPYFDNGFPHGVDQWISAAGTSWATMALTLASQTPVKVAHKNSKPRS